MRITPSRTRLKSLVLTLFLGITFTCSLRAQMLVDSSKTALQLAQALAGPGITVSNVTKTCPGIAEGAFTATGTNLGMPSGIVLTSGYASNVIGPNSQSGITGVNNTPGDVDLTNIAMQSTFDACVLEFDLVTCSDSIKFNYVFGSDEYTTFVGSPGSGSGFNDIFAFLISGPGIPGVQNIALVPGTTTPVSINNVNCLYVNQQYYVCNEDTTMAFPPCPSGSGCPLSNSLTTLEYDGFTTVLTARSAVQPGQVYHLKLAVADALDQVLDSGVFLQAGSLVGTGASISAISSYIDPTHNASACVEGCIDGQIQIQLNAPALTATVVHFNIGGNATNGVDYTSIADSITFNAGDSVHVITVNPLQDGLPEGSETVIFYLIAPCTGLPLDSVILYIDDNLDIKASNDTIICAGTSAPLLTTPLPNSYTYSWTPPAGLSCTNCPNPVASPTVNTTYYVTASWGACVASDTVQITVLGGIVNAGPDVQLCIGDSVHLNATGGAVYIWSPATGLSNTNTANPWCHTGVTTTYTVIGSDGLGNCSDTDQITVIVSPHLQGAAGTDTLICPGESVQLWATGGTFYLWQPDYNINNMNLSNPTVSPLQSTTYTVYLSNPAGCTDTQYVQVNVFPNPAIHVPEDTIIFIGESLYFYANGGIHYSWSPGTYLSDSTVATPLCTPLQTTTYTVTITDANGCSFIRTFTVEVHSSAWLQAPNAFSPNGDGVNDYFNYFVRGIFQFHQFRVYNRWGQVIFETSNPNDFWDGTHNGVRCEMGTYVYVVEGNDAQGAPVNLKGDVTLVR